MQTKPLSFFSVAAIVAAGYLVVGALCLALASAATHTVPVWLGAGVIFGALLVAPAERRGAVIVGALVASYVWGLLAHGLDVVTALPFALIEVLCAAIGAWVAGRAGRGEVNDVFDAGWLIAGALITALAGATLAAEFWQWQHADVAYGVEWRAWAYSTFVGILLAVPVITAFRGFRIKRSGGMPMAQFGAGALAFVAFLIITWIVFGADVQARFGSIAATLGYLPMPFLLLATLVWGPRGGALAMLVGALLIIAKTAAGGGPFAVADSFAGEAVIEVQAYVAVWAVLVLVARGLSESRRLARAQARDWQLRYERILGATGTASVEFDPVNGQAIWGEQAAAVLGGDALALQNIADWQARVEAPEQPLAEAAWHAVVQGRQPSVTSVYKVRLGHRLVEVQAQLAGVRGPDGAVERIAGLIRPLGGAAAGSQHG